MSRVVFLLPDRIGKLPFKVLDHSDGQLLMTLLDAVVEVATKGALSVFDG